MATGGGIGGVGGTAAAPVLSRFCAQNGEAYGWFCIQEGTGTPGMDGPSTCSRPSDLATDGGDGSGRPRAGDAPRYSLPAATAGNA